MEGRGGGGGRARLSMSTTSTIKLAGPRQRLCQNKKKKIFKEIKE